MMVRIQGSGLEAQGDERRYIADHRDDPGNASGIRGKRRDAKVINHLRGSVQLELTGRSRERFLNICARRKTCPFWRVEQPDSMASG